MVDLKRFRDGDDEYFEQIMQIRGPMVLRVCQPYADSHDHAKDLFQDIWTQVYLKRESFRGEGSFEAWLGRIAKNICINDLKARKNRADSLHGPRGEPMTEALHWKPPDPLREAERSELHSNLLQAMDQLPRREREAISLSVFDEKTSGEIAEVMGTKEATVRSTIRHGIKRLRELLGGVRK